MNPELYEHFRHALEDELRAAIVPPSSELHDLYGYLRYHMGWVDADFQPLDGPTGKRLRPIFCLLACQVCGGDWEQALPAAAAVELMHNFSLIHDDIEDGDTTRRGRATAWMVWGMPQALNAGDALFALAHLTLLRLAERGVPAQVIVEAVRLFGQTGLLLAEGQFLDMQFETCDEVSSEAYLRMVAGKTAALLAASCELGALIGGASNVQRERLYAFGHHLGIAFQIQDDVLGMWGEASETGKPVGSDLLRRKKTLPLLYGLGRSASLRALVGQAEMSSDDVTRAIELLDAVGSRRWAEAQAEVHTYRALDALEGAAGDPPASDDLRHLALGLLGRNR